MLTQRGPNDVFQFFFQSHIFTSLKWHMYHRCSSSIQSRLYRWFSCVSRNYYNDSLSWFHRTILISVALFFHILTACYPAGDVIVYPDHWRSISGSTVTITCESMAEIDWTFYPDASNSSLTTVFASGRMNELFVNRYHVRGEKRKNGWNYVTLVINPAVTTDTGRFVCSKTEDHVNGKSSRLIVYGERWWVR